MKSDTSTFRQIAFPALVIGAIGIAFAPIFVRLSELGPSATAFYRLAFALPVLWLYMKFEEKRSARKQREYPAPKNINEWKWFIYGGLLFTGDLAVWHWSIYYTTVANATLLANFAPIFVAFGAWMLFGERFNRYFIFGLIAALGGAALLIGVSIGLSKQQAFGDGLGLLTAVFYAGYILSVKRLRLTYSAVTIMTYTGVVSMFGLLIVTLLSGEGLIAATLYGWTILVLLALVSHAGGQAMIAYSLAFLPASFASVALLLQPATAAALAWVLLGEQLGIIEGFGGILVLTGIFLAWRGMVK